MDRLTAAIRSATEHADWKAVKELARQAASVRVGMVGNEELLRLGSAVHGSRILRPSRAALAFGGVADLPADAFEHARVSVVERLRELTRRDAEWARFYSGRAASFASLHAADGTAENGPLVDAALVRGRILDALEHGAFAEVERLAGTLTGNGAGDDRRPGPVLPVCTGDLTLPFGSGSAERAAALGMAMETLAADDCMQAALACRLTAGDDGGAPGVATRHTCRTEMRALCESLALVVRQSLVTSSGRRYLPSFDPETILVESFPEAEPDAHTPLLDCLGLARRHGLSRIEIEDAISRHTGAVCEQLGLDPFEFTVACVPFDVYVRLAPRYGWGAQPMWTHLDGYQVTRTLELRALVGGDVRYGGRHDFCMVGRRYDSSQLTARFVVARRSRFSGAIV
jgi:hypothetical protein